ncbi:ABC-type glycerol-3-phosphate transport system permease component [Paenibacillus castaneae]|uniref:carbohydrate ABC transporter permease n=1 Tax=Paenibacillus castaneae TaxID=474957 RepID=UPI000C99B264|nr:carbohydrate ABC transporter permease [Paenibacillus castaneae]NIK75288.1 ABC-type glycerol-3-phosphate transport system permease component [Paenibacillus castaneae]
MIHIKLHRSKSGIKRSYFADFGIYLFLLLFGIFMMMPMVYAISNSIKPLEEIWYFPPRFLVNNPTLENFRDLMVVMSDSWVPFSRYIFNTFFITAVGTLGHVVLASLCAYVLSKHHFPGKGILFSVVVLSLMFSGAVTQIPNFIIISKLGWIDSYQAIIIPAFASSLGLYLMKQFMDQMIPDAVLESARMDGASEWNIFWKIVMPMVKPAWLTLIIFSIQGLWGTGANHFIQSEELKTLNYALSQILAGGIVRTGTGSAAAVLMMIVPIIVFVISQSKIIETMSASGMKE